MVRKLVCAMLMLLVAGAAPIEWMTDLNAASRQAAAEGKLLLVEFTGSDWCKACLLQKKKVLNTRKFENWVEKHCVAVQIDVPNDAARVGGELQKRHNQVTCEEYGVSSFPRLRIMTPELVDAGGYNGAALTPEAAIARLEKAFPQARRLQQALSKTGAARTTTLCELYLAIPEARRKFHFPLLRLLAESDSANTTGFRDVYADQCQIRQLERSLYTSTNPGDRFSCARAALDNARPANLPYFRNRLGQVMREYALHLANTATTTQQVTQARDLMLQSIDYAASEQEKSQLRQYVQTHFANPAAFLQKNK